MNRFSTDYIQLEILIVQAASQPHHQPCIWKANGLIPTLARIDLPLSLSLFLLRAQITMSSALPAVNVSGVAGKRKLTKELR